MNHKWWILSRRSWNMNLSRRLVVLRPAVLFFPKTTFWKKTDHDKYQQKRGFSWKSCILIQSSSGLPMFTKTVSIQSISIRFLQFNPIHFQSMSKARATASCTKIDGDNAELRKTIWITVIESIEILNTNLEWREGGKGGIQIDID